MAISYTGNMQSLSQELGNKKLYQADHALTVPLQLALTDSPHPLLCQQIIRKIPGKRIVAFGQWGEHEVVAKLFYAKSRAKQQFQRELAGIEALTEANVPTPRLLYYGRVLKQKIYVLLFVRLGSAHSVEELWQARSSQTALAPLMRTVTVELATQHVLGILQKDLHLKNFLVTKQRLYTLDGGSIEKFDHPLNKAQSLPHLGLFFSQLGVGTERLQQSLFKTYIQARGWIVKPHEYQALEYYIQQSYQERWQRFEKKIFRNATDFKVVRTWLQHAIYKRSIESKALVEFIQNPDAFFNAPDTVLLKDGRSATVARVVLDNHTYVLKRYNIKGFWHGLRRLCRSTRAAESWRLGNCLNLLGVATAQPYAFIEKRCAMFRSTSYLLMEDVAGANLHTQLTTLTDETAKTSLAERVVQLLMSLRTLNLTHGDLKAANILIKDEKPILIDLDGMREHSNNWSLTRAEKQELKRFMKNWQNESELQRLFQQAFAEVGQKV